MTYREEVMNKLFLDFDVYLTEIVSLILDSWNVHVRSFSQRLFKVRFFFNISCCGHQEAEVVVVWWLSTGHSHNVPCSKKKKGRGGGGFCLVQNNSQIGNRQFETGYAVFKHLQKTTEKSDCLSLSTVSVTIERSDCLSVSTVSVTIERSDCLSLSTVSVTTEKSNCLSLSTVSVESDCFGLSTVSVTDEKSDCLSLSTVSVDSVDAQALQYPHKCQEHLVTTINLHRQRGCCACIDPRA